MRTNRQRGVTVLTLILSVTAAILAGVLVTNWLIKREGGLPTASADVPKPPPAQASAAVAAAPAQTASTAQSTAPSASKSSEVVFSKDDKLSLANSGLDAGKTLGWRDSVDESICTQMNRYEVRELASQLSTKSLVLRPDTSKALLALLEVCQPGLTAHRLPPTIYLSKEEKDAMLTGKFGEGVKALGQQSGGISLSSCSMLSKGDIDQLSNAMTSGRLELSERSRQQLTELLEQCRK
jgi:hypothetical protein